MSHIKYVYFLKLPYFSAFSFHPEVCFGNYCMYGIYTNVSMFIHVLIVNSTFCTHQYFFKKPSHIIICFSCNEILLVFFGNMNSE